MGGSHRPSEENSAYSRENTIFSQDEDDLITRLYNLLGERWALIAGRIPGRTAEEIEKYWKNRKSSG
eukprot:Gb_17330 [translate_table: standard]